MVAKYLSASFYMKQYPQYNRLHFWPARNLRARQLEWYEWSQEISDVWSALRRKFDIVRCVHSPFGQGRLSYTVILRLKQEGLPKTLDVVRSVLWHKDVVVLKLIQDKLPGFMEDLFSLLLDEGNYDFWICNQHEPKHLQGPFYLYEFSIKDPVFWDPHK